MVIMRAASCALTVATILLLDASAFAQVNPFGRASGGRITNDDLHLIEAAASKLYKADNPQVGASEKWNNPTTGNAGTVSLTQVFEKDGMPCRKLRHRIAVKGAKDPLIYIFNRCRVKSGDWKLL
jgi:surface antigen